MCVESDPVTLSPVLAEMAVSKQSAAPDKALAISGGFFVEGQFALLVTTSARGIQAKIDQVETFPHGETNRETESGVMKFTPKTQPIACVCSQCVRH